MTLEKFLERECNFKQFIANAFTWAKTPEGDDYWLEIYNTDPSEIGRAHV